MDPDDQIEVGGLRNACDSVSCLPQLCRFGRSLGLSLEKLLPENSITHQKQGTCKQAWISQVCDLVGCETPNACAPAEAVHAFREVLIKACDAPHADPVRNEHCTADIRAHLLEAWRSKGMDPDDQIS